MKKNFGVKNWMFPMPVLMIGTYNEDGTPDMMNAAWGGITLEDEITICIDTSHKTWANIVARKAFTVAFGTAGTVKSCDYLGIVSGNKTPDKVVKSGLTAVKSEFVNAPIIEEFPVVMECTLAEVTSTDSFYAIVGKIINTAAEERVLDEKGKVDPAKLEALIFDQFRHGYYVSGEQVGKAWNAGAGLMNR
jgi:flavin reductase (DIM6/NTAB) family NADH-FMN oxidoreductase RutF